MTPRALPAVAALAAIGLAAALGAVVAERMRARFEVRPPVEGPEEPLVLERLPYDPLPSECAGAVPAIERTYGAATLRLRLRADPGGGAAAMRVRLWRLGVPEDAAYSEGDELRAALDVPEEGVTIERLPAGRYRVQCLDARDAPDPPEFGISDGVNERDVEVPVRRGFRLRLRIVDENSAVVQRTMMCPGWTARAHSSEDDLAPRWATPLRRKGEELWSDEFPSFGVGHSLGKDTGPIVTSDRDGFFDLGRHQDPRRGEYERTWPTFVTESRACVSVAVDEEIGVDSTFVGVAPLIGTVLARVVLPNGEFVDPSTAEVAAWSDAERHPWDVSADAWRTIPVHVKVVVEDCEPLEFVWTANTADDEHTLVPLPPRPLR